MKIKESKVRSVLLNITHEQYDELKRMSKELDCSMSVIVREALDRYLDKQDRSCK